MKWVSLLAQGVIVSAVLVGACMLDNASAKECTFVKQLSPIQADIAHRVYITGDNVGLGYTAVAVAWQESKLGKYTFRFGRNTQDVSVGIMQTAVKWKVGGMSPFEAGRWVQAMIEDPDKSIDVGVQDLLYWRIRSNSWMEMLGKYNGGNKPNYSYARKVADTYLDIKNCRF